MRNTRILFYLFTVSLLLLSCIKDDADSEGMINYVSVNDHVPTFAVEDTAGNKFSSKQFVGKNSLLVFFGTYCPDCKKVLPVIEEVWTELKDDPRYQLIAISRGEEENVVSEYWESNRFTMPFYLDPDKQVFSLFANNTIPRIYIVSPDNVVTWMSVESLELSAKELISKIKESK